MKRYEKYKESNVVWLGEIPDHWEERFLFQCASDKKCSNKGMVNQNLLSLSYGRIIRKNIDTTSGLLPDSFETYQIVDAGDVIMRLTDLQNDKRSLRTGLAAETGIITSAYVCLHPKKSINSIFFHYLLHSYDVKKLFYSLGGGLRQGCGYSDLKKVAINLPSREEQEQIVRYLDWKVALADKFVADKRKQIELLKEYRQAEINKAVTKGLNTDTPMRDSGIDWIGDVPAHWEYNRFSHLFQFGKGLNITKQDLGEEGYSCLNYGEIHSKFGFEVIPERDKLKCIKTDDQRLNDKSKLMRGDFIFADTSEDFEGSGNFTYFNSDADAYAGYHTVLLRPNHLVKDFRCLAYITDSLYVRMQIQKKVCGIKVFSITKQILKDVFVYQPPIEEQQQIVAYLDTISERVNKAIDDIEQQIKLVAEYKTTLISDVVTGKVDVRGVGIPQQNS